MTTSRRPGLSIVVPTWNGAETLREHLPSVIAAAEEAGDAEVVVSDDGSSDDTAGLLASRFPGVRSVRRQANGGFALAANAGVYAARGRNVLLLNNDIEVLPGAVPSLAAAIDGDPSAFAAVPSIIRTASGEEEALTRIRFARGVVSTDLAGSEAEGPAYACGGAMMFRRDEFEWLGGFDPVFAPFYWEDVDLSYRARKRGRRIAYVATARVEHDHGRTIGSRFTPPQVARVYERNRLLFTWRNLTDPALRALHWALLPTKLAWNAVSHPSFVAGFRDAWALRPGIRSFLEHEREKIVVSDRDLLA